MFCLHSSKRLSLALFRSSSANGLAYKASLRLFCALGERYCSLHVMEVRFHHYLNTYLPQPVQQTRIRARRRPVPCTRNSSFSLITFSIFINKHSSESTCITTEDFSLSIQVKTPSIKQSFHCFIHWILMQLLNDCNYQV